MSSPFPKLHLPSIFTARSYNSQGSNESKGSSYVDVDMYNDSLGTFSDKVGSNEAGSAKKKRNVFRGFTVVDTVSRHDIDPPNISMSISTDTNPSKKGGCNEAVSAKKKRNAFRGFKVVDTVSRHDIDPPKISTSLSTDTDPSIGQKSLSVSLALSQDLLEIADTSTTAMMEQAAELVEQEQDTAMSKGGKVKGVGNLSNAAGKQSTSRKVVSTVVVTDHNPVLMEQEQNMKKIQKQPVASDGEADKENEPKAAEHRRHLPEITKSSSTLSRTSRVSSSSKSLVTQNYEVARKAMIARKAKKCADRSISSKIIAEDNQSNQGSRSSRVSKSNTKAIPTIWMEPVADSPPEQVDLSEIGVVSSESVVSMHDDFKNNDDNNILGTADKLPTLATTQQLRIGGIDENEAASPQSVGLNSVYDPDIHWNGVSGEKNVAGDNTPILGPTHEQEIHWDGVSDGNEIASNNAPFVTVFATSDSVAEENAAAIGTSTGAFNVTDDPSLQLDDGLENTSIKSEMPYKPPPPVSTPSGASGAGDGKSAFPAVAANSSAASPSTESNGSRQKQDRPTAHGLSNIQLVMPFLANYGRPPLQQHYSSTAFNQPQMIATIMYQRPSTRSSKDKNEKDRVWI